MVGTSSINDVSYLTRAYSSFIAAVLSFLWLIYVRAVTDLGALTEQSGDQLSTFFESQIAIEGGKEGKG